MSYVREVYHPRTDKIMTPNEIRFAKRLAGLSLMKLNASRSKSDASSEIVSRPKYKKPRCGLLYLISNPAWPDFMKIGVTQNIQGRLSQYQTYDPFRQFKVEHYKFVEDMRKTESYYLKICKTDISKGEWVERNKALDMFFKNY